MRLRRRRETSSTPWDKLLKIEVTRERVSHTFDEHETPQLEEPTGL